MKRAPVVTAVFVALLGCSSNDTESRPSEELGDGEFDAALLLGKADGSRYTSCELDHLLEYVNASSTTKAALQSIGVTSRSAAEVIAHRDGADATFGTGDDDLYDDEGELDNVRYVGPQTFGAMVNQVSGACVNWMQGPPPAPVVTRVGARASMPPTIPADFHYRIHLIDVGTGLAILVQGHDFNVLFDGGSGDDNGSNGATGSTNRLIAYLFAALGPSGDAPCKPLGDPGLVYTGGSLVRIDHVIMSHPHLDHGSLLDDVVRCYDVRHVWESGAVNDAVFYKSFLEAVAAEPQLTYHTAGPPADNHAVHVLGTDVQFPDTLAWVQFSDRTHVPLGHGASFTIAAADPERHPDANDNSLVMRMDLGTTSLLLVGDAESGERLSPNMPVDGMEEALIRNHPHMLNVDILQVGHHGSMTSNRMEFLQHVSPAIALIGVGTKSYHGVRLPDADVIAALTAVGAVIHRTDVNDYVTCPDLDRVGQDDWHVGGCDNYIVELSPPAPNESYSCLGRCGDASTGSCRCDTDCVLRNDCCQDLCTECVSLPVCEPFGLHPELDQGAVNMTICGMFDATQSCSYAENCANFGDCCTDICRHCPMLQVCGAGMGYEDDPFM